eukprot:947861_1
MFMFYRLWFTFKATTYALTKISITIHSLCIVSLFVLFVLIVVFINLSSVLALSICIGLVGIIYVGGLITVSCQFNIKLLRLVKRSLHNQSVNDVSLSKQNLRILETISKHTFLATVVLMFGMICLMIWMVMIAISLNEEVAPSLFIDAARTNACCIACLVPLIVYFGLAKNKNTYTRVCSTCHNGFLNICKSYAKKQVDKQRNIQSTEKKDNAI